MLLAVAKIAIDAAVAALRASEVVGRRARQRRAHLRAAERGVAARWGEPLGLFAEHVDRCCEIGDELRRVRGRLSGLDQARELLWARGCQIGWEISRLMTGGFADGAYARWRTLHELAVVSAFLTKHGETAAERFFAHSAVKNAKKAREYKECSKELNYELMSSSTRSSPRKTRRSLNMAPTSKATGVGLRHFSQATQLLKACGRTSECGTGRHTLEWRMTPFTADRTEFCFNSDILQALDRR
jgi:hypothetical protein